eukprot:TRINITY_DN51679_c0_g1_i1.p1 TRINITY_DN51679_c0_g1~~TRINITY_DN51679_c0_g1_i1.p1  ORF type:complete len:202 (-),score=18.73 TRINITY_DN51679_c0_g1_i1:47-652(-)
MCTTGLRVVNDKSECNPKSELCVTTKDHKLVALPIGPWMRSNMINGQWKGGDSGLMDIPLEEVDLETLQHVHEYLDHYSSEEPQQLPMPMRPRLKDCPQVSDWDRDFLWNRMLVQGDEKQHEPLLKTALAANCLAIDSLRDLCCAMLADMFRGKSTRRILDMFGIEGEINPQEIAEVEAQYPWMRPQESGEDVVAPMCLES